jgi:ribosome-binding factor A
LISEGETRDDVEGDGGKSMSQRTERVDELLRQEIGAILSREVKDPRIGFATITDVETTPDLRHARVWVSVIGGRADREETVVALQHTMHFVRRELGTRLRLKRIPELHVRLDDSAERGTRILRLLQELEEGRTLDETDHLEPLPTPVRRLPHEGDAEEALGAESAGSIDAAGGAPGAESGSAPRRGGRRGPAGRGSRGTHPHRRAGRTGRG